MQFSQVTVGLSVGDSVTSFNQFVGGLLTPGSFSSPMGGKKGRRRRDNDENYDNYDDAAYDRK